MMAKISLPFHDAKRSIELPQWGTFTLRPFQLLVFVSITEQGYKHCDGAPIVPALIDTGNSLCFTLHEEQLKAAKPWNMKFQRFDKVYSVYDFHGNIHTAASYNADVWIHDFTLDSLPRSLLVSGDDSANSFKLSLAQDGIACFSSETFEAANIKRKKTLVQSVKSWFTGGPARPAGAAAIRDVERQRSKNSDRLSLPHLPLLGLRALCLNSLTLEMVCNPLGGNLAIINDREYKYKIDSVI